jgi:DNA-directed RNA polymerase specialized sigma24 family protein
VSKARRFLERLDPLQGSLTAYCWRLLWFPGDLENALQETLAVAYRGFTDADPPSTSTSWARSQATVKRFGSAPTARGALP